MDWREALAAFYREVDKDVERRAAAAGVACRGCGECCHFDTVEHLVYASALERRYLELAAVPAESPDADARLLAAGLRCPFQQGEKCLARSGRVLGCRLHYCEWPDAGEAEDMAEAWHARLKRLHDELGEEWEYARLFPLAEWNGAENAGPENPAVFYRSR